MHSVNVSYYLQLRLYRLYLSILSLFFCWSRLSSSLSLNIILGLLTYVFIPIRPSIRSAALVSCRLPWSSFICLICRICRFDSIHTTVTWMCLMPCMFRWPPSVDVIVVQADVEAFFSCFALCVALFACACWASFLFLDLNDDMIEFKAFVASLDADIILDGVFLEPRQTVLISDRLRSD